VARVSAFRRAFRDCGKGCDRGACTPARATEDFVVEVARSLDLDADQFADDLFSADTDAQLRKSEALANVFRLPGTPALIVGSTVVVGAIDNGRLRDLVALERSA